MPSGLESLLSNPRRLRQYASTPGNYESALDYASQASPARVGRRPAGRTSTAKTPGTLETGEVIEQISLPDGSLVKPATESGKLVKVPGKSNLYLDPATGEPYQPDPTKPTGLRSAYETARQVKRDGKVYASVSGVGERELGPDPKAAEDAAKAAAKIDAENRRLALDRERRPYQVNRITGEPIPRQTDEEWAAIKQAKAAKLDEAARVKRLKDQADLLELDAAEIRETAPKPAKEDEEAFTAAESALSQFAAGQDMEEAAAKYAAAPATDEASQQAKAAAENYLAYKDKVKPAKEAEKKVQELEARARDIKRQIIDPKGWKAGKAAEITTLADDDLVAEVKAQADIINEQEEKAVGTLDFITEGRNKIVAEINAFQEERRLQSEQGLNAEEIEALDQQQARLEQTLADYDEHNAEAKAESDAALKAAADRRDVLAVAGTELEGRAAKQAEAASQAQAKAETMAKAKPLYEGWAKGLYSDDWRAEEETPRLAQEAAKAGLDVASAKEALQTYRQLDWSNTRRDSKTAKPINEESRTLPDGNVTVNPTMWGDAEAYKKAVEASQGTPEGKAKAIEAFPKLQEIHAEKAVEILSKSANIPGADNFMAWRERKIEEDQATQGKLGFARQSPAKQAIAYMEEMKNRSWFRKAGEQVGLGLLAGFQDIATQALGVGAMVTGSETLADLAAANTENTQSVVGAQNLEGSDTDYALRVMGMGARMTPAVAAMISGAGAVGGGLGTAAVLAGGQTAGSMFADLYRTAKDEAGLSHGEAWKKAALPAALAGTITGLLTKGMGATGLERVFSDAATQEAARNTFKAMLGQFVKGAAEELPEEIADEYFTTILQESAASADPVATFKNFANTLPELAGVTALMGGAGSLMQARRQDSGQEPGMAPPPEGETPAMPVQPRPAGPTSTPAPETLTEQDPIEAAIVAGLVAPKRPNPIEAAAQAGLVAPIRPRPQDVAAAAEAGLTAPTAISKAIANQIAKFNPTGATPLPQSVAATAKRTGRPPAAVARQAASGVVKIAQGQSLESLDIEEQEALGFVNKGGKITPDTKVTPLVYLYKDKPVLRNAAAEWLTDEAQEGLAGMVNLTEAERKAQIDAEEATAASKIKGKTAQPKEEKTPSGENQAAKKKAGQAKPAKAESTPQAGPEVKTSDSLSENEGSTPSPATISVETEPPKPSQTITGSNAEMAAEMPVPDVAPATTGEAPMEQPPAQAQEAPPEPPPAATEPDLTPKQADQMARAKADYESSMRYAEADPDPQIRESRKKAAGMKFSAAKRLITGKLTGKEQEAKAKREASNFEGKAVSVDGKNAEVIGNAFGKVKVKFTDGTKATVPAAKIKPPVETSQAPAQTQARPQGGQTEEAGVSNVAPGEGSISPATATSLPQEPAQASQKEASQPASALDHPAIKPHMQPKHQARVRALEAQGVQVVTVETEEDAAKVLGVPLKRKGNRGVTAIVNGKPVVIFIAKNFTGKKGGAAVITEELHHAAALVVLQQNPQLLNEALAEVGGLKNGTAIYSQWDNLSPLGKLIEAAAAYASGKWNPDASSPVKRMVDAILEAISKAFGLDAKQSKTATAKAIRSLADSADALMATEQATKEPAPSPAPTSQPAGQAEAELAQVGDEVAWLAAGKKAQGTIYRVRGDVADIEYFGPKTVPLTELRIVRKSSRRLAQEKRDAKFTATPQQKPQEQDQPKPVKKFTKAEIESLEQGRTPEGWTLASSEPVAVTDTKGQTWQVKTQFSPTRTMTLVSGDESRTFDIQRTHKASQPEAQPAQPPRPATPEGRAEAALAEYEAEVRKTLVGKPSKADRDLATRKLDLAKRLRARLKAMAGAVDFDVYAKDLRAKSGELEVKPVGRKGSILFINPEKLIDRLTAKHATTEAGREAMDVFILHEFIHKAAIGNMDGAKIIGLYNLLTPEAKAASKELYLSDSGLTDFWQDDKEFAAAHEWFAQLVEARLRGKISNQAEIEASQDPAFRDRLLALLRDFVAQLRDIAKLVTDKAQAARIEAEADAVQAIVADMAAKAGLELGRAEGGLAAEPATSPNLDAGLLVIDQAIRRYDERSRPYEGGQGLAVGAENANDRIAADALMSMKRAVRAGKDIDEALKIAIADAHEMVRNHNRKRPKDINWQRWEGTADSILTMTAANAKSALAKPTPAPQAEPAQASQADEADKALAEAFTGLFLPPSGLRLKQTRAQLIKATEDSSDWKDWYQRHEDTLTEFFGVDADLFQRILSVTSQAASVKANVGLALKAYVQLKTGAPFEGYLPAVIKNLQRVKDAAQVQGQKIAAYQQANTGADEVVVVDRHISRMLFGVDSPTAKQFQKGQQVLTQIAAVLGWQPRQVQAAMWAASIRKAGNTPESYDSYLRELNKRGTLNDRIGSVVPTGVQNQRSGGSRGLDSTGSNQASLRLPPQGSLEQTDLPRDRRDAMMKAASVLVDAGVKTPAELAARLDKLAPGGQLRQYSRAFWRLMSGFDSTLEEKPDWQAVYQASQAPVAGKVGIPSLGDTGKAIWQGWKGMVGISVMPGESVVGVDVHNGGEYFWSGEELMRSTTNAKQGYALSRPATKAEIEGLHNSIDRGGLQIESRVNTGATGMFPKVDGGKTTRVFHQATGKPLAEFLETPAGKKWSERDAETQAIIAKLHTDSPAQAEAKVEEHVQAVAEAEGARPAKDIKAELVQRLEGYVATALENESIRAKQIREELKELEKEKESNTFGRSNARRINNRIEALGKELERETATKEVLTIQIPGDGTFKILNTADKLKSILARVKQMPVNPQPDKPETPVYNKGEKDQDAKFLADRVLETEGTPAAAIAFLKEQLAGAPKSEQAITKQAIAILAKYKPDAPPPSQPEPTRPAPPVTAEPSVAEKIQQAAGAGFTETSLPKAKPAFRVRTLKGGERVIEKFEGKDKGWTRQIALRKGEQDDAWIQKWVESRNGFLMPTDETAPAAEPSPAKQTREEVAEAAQAIASQDPSIPPPAPDDVETLQALRDRANRRPYNPDKLTPARLAVGIRAGWVTKTKEAKLTEKGYSKLAEWEQQQSAHDRALEALSDKLVDEAVSKWDRENDPTSWEAMNAARQPSPAAQAPAEAPASQPAQPSAPEAGQGGQKARLADFGEKLGGARKDKVATVNEELTDDEIAGKTLSEIWPKSEIASIEDDELAAYATTLRSVIPTKPQKGYKLNAWVAKVKTVKELMRFAAEKGVPEMVAMLRSTKYNLSSLADKIAILQGIPREHWDRIGEVRNFPNAYRYGEGAGNMRKIPTPHAEAEVDGRNVRADNLDALLEAVSAKVAEGKTEPKMQFEVRGRTGKWGINKKGDPLYRKLKIFEDSKEALAYITSNYADLVAAWESVKERDNIKETDLRKTENRPRTAEDWRKGKDATPEMFAEAFGFRGVEFGNWVSQGKNAKERQGMMNEAYDALNDLASILNIPTKALSLNGQIGLGFGSRGHGWASAHYEPGNLVINLTKTRGAGSLAHELFHAFDHYFGRARGASIKNNAGVYITNEPETRYVNEKTGHSLSVKRWNEIKAGRGRIANEEDWKLQKGVRPEVEEAFTALVKALDDSPMAKRAKLNDKGKQGYWGSTIERAARSFENYVIYKMQQKGYQNDYLANVVRIEDFVRDPGRYPYLLDEEIEPVAKAFDDLFSTIKTRETDKGVALYNPPQPALALPPGQPAVTPAQDAEYMAAVEAGDMAKAQAMVDEAAFEAGFTHSVKHGTAKDADFDIFDRNARSQDHKLFEMDNWGIWTTHDDARIYGEKVLHLMGKMEHPKVFQNFDEWFDDYVKIAYPLFYFEGIKSTELAADLRDYSAGYFKSKKVTPPVFSRSMTKEYKEMLSEMPGAQAYHDHLKSLGYDGVLMEGGFLDGQLQTVRVFLDANQLKSADPITYDESGNVIPLSQRFNPASPSILRNPPAPEGGPAAQAEPADPDADMEAFIAEQQAIAEEEEAVRLALLNDPNNIEAMAKSGKMDVRNKSLIFRTPAARRFYQAVQAATTELGMGYKMNNEELRAWARKQFEADPNGSYEWALENAYDNAPLRIEEQALVYEVMERMFEENSPFINLPSLDNDKIALATYIDAFRSDKGRELQFGVDQVETPQQRWNRAFAHIIGPDRKQRHAWAAAPSASSKAKKIADLEERLAVAQDRDKRDIEAALKEAEKIKTSEDVLEEITRENKKILDGILAKMGNVTRDDITHTPTERIALQSAILDLKAVKDGLDQFRGKDNDGYNIMRLAFRGFSDAHIANALNLNQDDVGQFITAATNAIIRPAVAEQVKAGTGFGGLVKAGFARLKKAVGLGLPPRMAGQAALDKEYMDAVEAGDMEKAQRMVDEAAKAVGYDSDSPFYFGARERGLKITEIGDSIFVTDDIDAAKDYADSENKPQSFYLAGKVAEIQDLDIDWSSSRWSEYHLENGDGYSDLDFGAMLGNKKHRRTIAYELRRAGFAALHFSGDVSSYNQIEHDSWLVADPSKIKSADPVTYDESGKVIPLSKRFPTNPSLSLPPKPIEAQPALIKGARQTVADVTTEVNRVMKYALQSAKARNSGKLMSKVVMTPGGQRVRVFVPFDPDDMANYYAFAREYTAAKAGKFDKLYEYWINWPLLSGPQTQVANITGNAAQVAWHYTGQRLAEATLNLAYQDPNAPQFREFKHILKGFWQGIGPAFEMARQTFLTEGDTIRHKYLGEPMQIDMVDGDLDKVGNIRASVGGKLGRINRLPGRVLRFTDAFFKTAIMYAEASAVAYRRAHVEAKSQGLKGKARANFIDTEIANTLNDPSSAVWGEVMKTAEELLFQDENMATEIVDTALGGYKGIRDLEKLLAEAEAKGDSELAAKLQKRIRSRKFVGSLMRWIFPFQRTPTNIVRAGIKKAGGSAISLLYGLTMAGWRKAKDGTDFVKSYPKAMQIKDASETLLAGLGWLALASMLEGDDNDDEKPVLLVGTRSHSLKERAATDQFLRKYGGENSIVWQDGKGKVLGSLPFGRYEPAATLLTTWIDAYRNYQEVKRLKSQGENASYSTYMLSSLVSSLEDKSFLQGFANAMQFIRDVEEKRENPDENAGVKMLMNNVIPNLIKQPLRNMDDVLRERTTAGPGYAALPNPTVAPKLPAFAAQPKISTTGERMPKAFTPPVRLLFQANTKVTPQPDALLYRANRLNPRKRWSPQPLNRDDYTADPPGKAPPVPITDPAKRRQFAELAGRLYAAKAAQVAAKAAPSERAAPGESLIKAFKEAREDAMAAARKQAHAMGLHKATATP